MVSKKFLFGLLAISLVFGMMAIGCDPDENTDPKVIIINDLDDFNGKKAGIALVDTFEGLKSGDLDDSVASAGLQKNISIVDNSVKLNLLDDGEVFTGSGSYYIALNIYDGASTSIYVYTNGAEEVTVQSDVKKLEINQGEVKISFKKFTNVSDEPLGINFNIVQ